MGDLTKNFNRAEFACKGNGCCNKTDFPLDMRMVEALQVLRDKLGVPLKITSGYRCPRHNKAVGGAPKSQHLYGTAADVATPKGLSSQELYHAADALGKFDGLGIYDWGVHVDVRGSKARWDYRRK